MSRTVAAAGCQSDSPLATTSLPRGSRNRGNKQVAKREAGAEVNSQFEQAYDEQDCRPSFALGPPSMCPPLGLWAGSWENPGDWSEYLSVIERVLDATQTAAERVVDLRRGVCVRTLDEECD